jgi:hypothetical protein
MEDFYNALFALLGVVITAFIIPWLSSLAKTEKQKHLLLWAEQAVNAAEQLIGTGKGGQKKDYAMCFLINKGVSKEEAEVLLESAAKLLKNK